MSINPDDYQYLVTFGPEANCTLALCPAEWSLQGYRPSIGANIAFIALFFIGMVWHLFQGFRYKTWFFTISIVLGCIGEMVGYGGRIMLWQNPFSFDGFIIEIVCITLSPVFFAAAIYVSLTRITNFLDPKLCRFPPKLYYWVFIPTDIVSLILQAVGGAVSSSSTGKDEYAVDLTIAGLSFQVFTLFVFICMAGEYIFRYSRHRRALPLSERRVITTRLKIFAGFFSAAIIFILIRCCYRIAELAQGYTGSIFREQSLFIALESVMIVLAVFSLNIGHPGIRFPHAISRNGKNWDSPAIRRLQMELTGSRSTLNGHNLISVIVLPSNLPYLYIGLGVVLPFLRHLTRHYSPTQSSPTSPNKHILV